MKFLTCLAVLSVVTAGCSSGGSSPSTSAAPTGESRRAHPADAFRDTVGVASLQQLRHMAVSGKASALLTGHASDIDRARLGDAERTKEVRCKDLAEYRAGDDVRPLLVEQDAVYYPVSVDGEVVSSVAMRKQPDGTWDVAGMGRATLAKAIDQTGKKLAASRGVEDHALVEIRALHLRFLEDDAAGQPMLTPLEDVAAIGLKAGQSAPAADVFEGLAERAQSVCGGSSSR